VAVRVIPSTCTECLVQCGSLVHVDGDKVIKIAGNPAHPGSQGAFCIKGANGPVANRDSPRRITHPLRRTGERGAGQWERISWDEAFEGIAAGLAPIIREHGGEAIAGASATFTQSRGTAVRLLLRSLGSPNYMINQDMCHGGRATSAILTGFGGNPGNELRKSRVILVVGKSPSESDVVEWMYIKHACASGAKLIVIDPRRTQVSKLADHWLTPRAGTDAALALAMIHVILSEGLQDEAFVSEWCSGTEALRERAAQYAPAVAAAITGIAAADIEAAARLFATTKPGSMILGHGIDAQENGVHTAMAFHCLLALTGNIDREGSNRAAKTMPGYRGNYAYFINNADFRMSEEAEAKTIGGRQYPLWSGRDTYSQSCHNPSVLDAIETGLPYPVRAMYVSGTNIACTYPDMARTVSALKKLDLLVVASDQMTPTAEYADYFLPKTTLLEEEEVLLGQSEPCLSLSQQILPAMGEARTDLAIAIGLRDGLAKLGLVAHDVIPWRSNREFMEYALSGTSVTLDALRVSGFHALSYGYGDYLQAGFKTPSRKFEFNPQRIAGSGGDALPDYKPPVYAPVGDGFDLTLMTGIRSMAFHHSRYREHAWARKIKNAPELSIHPDAAARLRLGRDDWVWVRTRESDRPALLKLRISEEVPPHVVATGVGWWYPEMRGPDHGAALFSVGSAMRYGPAFDPISGSPSQSRNTGCRIERADPGEVERLLGEKQADIA